MTISKMKRRTFLQGASAVALMSAIPQKATAKMDDFVDYDAMGQAALVRSGQVTPAELVEAAIKRIEKINPILNAVVHPLFDEGRAIATTTLPNGPFAGVPYLIKDLSEMDGAPLTFGSKMFANNIADFDNGSVVSAKKGGFVIIGKTNTPEFGFISTTESQLLGAARNPYNTAYHTGGSSGGAAAAAASGMVPMAHASDGGGSIRIPASVNGLVGLKPSRGRLYVNTPPLSDADIAVRLAVTRTVRDTAQILNVAEKKGIDATHKPIGFVAEASRKRLKIAFMTKTYAGTDAEPDVRRAVAKTARLCANLGHKVEETNNAVVDGAFIDHFMAIWSAGAYELVQNARLIGLTQGRWVNAEDMFEPWTHGLAELFKRTIAKDPDAIQNAVAHFKKVEADYAAFFENYDVILTPVLRRPPLLIGEQGSHKSYDALYDNVMDYVTYTAQYNAAGVPAISLPLYMSRAGLPIGSQFAAKMGDEATLLQLAYELETAKPWKKRWPAISAKRL